MLGWHAACCLADGRGLPAHSVGLGASMNRDVYLATMISLATAAFGVVAPLAWNVFITELVTSVLGAQGGLMGLLIYAVVLTILAVIVITWLGRMAERSGAKPGDLARTSRPAGDRPLASARRLSLVVRPGRLVD